MKKRILMALLALTLASAAGATEFTGTVQVPKFGLFGVVTSAADTTFTLNFNNGSQSGTAVFTQTVALASATTPSLATGTLTGGGTTTFSLTVNAIVTTDTQWTGYISYGDGETTGALTINATAAAAAVADYSVTVDTIRSPYPGIGLTRIVWESDNAGGTTGTVILPLGLIRSVRFFNTIAPSENYDFTLKDDSGFDCLVSLGANLTSASTTTKNPVLNTSYPVAVYGSYQLLGTNAGADRSGRIEITTGN